MKCLLYAIQMLNPKYAERFVWVLAFTVNAAYGQFYPDTVSFPQIRIYTNGAPIPDEPRIFAEMEFIDLRPSTNGYKGLVSIERRGSTSQTAYPKKSYGFTTLRLEGTDTVEYNIGLWGMPEEHDWVLYAPYVDKSLIRNALAFDLSRKMGHYASRVRFAELWLNGQYDGVYCLQEKVKRDQNRVPVSKLKGSAGDALTGGYILKIDKTTGNTGPGWKSAFDAKVRFNHHYPSVEEMTVDQIGYIRNFMFCFERALYEDDYSTPVRGYENYIHTASFIDYFLLVELGRTVDGYRSSTFMYKENDDKGGKLHMGPVWDFNTAFGNSDYCEGFLPEGWQYRQREICPWYSPHIPFWWEKLLDDPQFVDALRCRWDILRHGAFANDSIDGMIDAYAVQLRGAQARNYERWPILGDTVPPNYFVGPDFESEIDYLKQWIHARAGWMDKHLPGFSFCPPSVRERPTAKEVRLYPNPSSGGRVCLEFGRENSRRINVCDVLGREIMRFDNQGALMEFVTDSWPDGMYYATIIEPQRQYTLPFWVKR